MTSGTSKSNELGFPGAEGLGDESVRSPGADRTSIESDDSDYEGYAKKRFAGPEFDALRELTIKEYRTGRQRRFGTTNPEIQNIPFCNAMMETGVDPWTALKLIPGAAELHEKRDGGSDERESEDEDSPVEGDPTWTAGHRVGQTRTELPDGRVVLIGGEHEDSYDPDFCIYNDVMVVDEVEDEQGNLTTLYGYPREVFPPTDFHTATRVGHRIYIIGCMGYSSEPGIDESTTPVYCLDTHDFSIEKITTTGEQPAGLNRHKAWLLDDGKIELVHGKVNIRTLKEDGSERWSYGRNVYKWFFDTRKMEWSKSSQVTSPTRATDSDSEYLDKMDDPEYMDELEKKYGNFRIDDSS